MTTTCATSDMIVTATGDTPDYTPNGAMFPIIALNSGFDTLTVEIIRPDGTRTEAVLTNQEAREVRAYLDFHLGDTL